MSIIEWIIKIKRAAQSEGWSWLINGKFVNNIIHTGLNRDLFELKTTFISTSKGLNLMRMYPQNPRILWEKHEAHLNSLGFMQKIAIKLVTRLTNMKISEVVSRSVFLEKFDTTIIAKHNVISYNNLPE